MMVDGVWVTADDYLTRRWLRQDRKAERAMTRAARRERFARIHAELADAASVKRLLMEAVQAEQAHRRFALRLRVRAERPAVKQAGSRPRRPLALRPSRFPRMRRIPVDGLGRIGVFYRQTYIGAGGKGDKAGCARAGWVYVSRDGAVLCDTAGNPVVIGNLGTSVDEIGEAWDVVEHAARNSRTNAKIQYRVVLALDAAASPAEMAAAVAAFTARAFGHLDIPHSAVIHRPGPEGDERNWHVHILYNLRPMRAFGDGGWEIADDLVNELDGKDGIRLLRHLWAHAMTDAAREAGRDASYTGLGYAARGLDLESQAHLGPALANMVARGAHVPAHARNVRIAAMNDLRIERRELVEQQEALMALREALLSRQERASAKPVSRCVTADLAVIAPPCVRGRDVGGTGDIGSGNPNVEPFKVRPTLPIRLGVSAGVVPRPSTLTVSLYPRGQARISALWLSVGNRDAEAVRTGAAMRLTTLTEAVSAAVRVAPYVAGGIRPLADVPTRSFGKTAEPASARSSPAPSPRRGSAGHRLATVRQPPVRDAPEPYTVETVIAPRRTGVAAPAPTAPAPVHEAPSWRQEVERYLLHVRLRAQEDLRSRKRLAGYGVLPPAYLKAVQDVEAHPAILAERNNRSYVVDRLAPERARAIQAVIDDPQWREFLRRVRAVGLEISARATLPVGAFETSGEQPHRVGVQYQAGRQSAKSPKRGRGLRKT